MIFQAVAGGGGGGGGGEMGGGGGRYFKSILLQLDPPFLNAHFLIIIMRRVNTVEKQAL